jgi:hypothetical protein
MSKFANPDDLVAFDAFDDQDCFPEGLFTSDEASALHGAVMRTYFEEGCLCVLAGRLTKLPLNVPDWEAVKHYELHCCCSRNYLIDERHYGVLSGEVAPTSPVADDEVPF